MYIPAVSCTPVLALTATSLPIVPPNPPVLIAGTGLSTLPTTATTLETYKLTTLVNTLPNTTVLPLRLQVNPLIAISLTLIDIQEILLVIEYYEGNVIVTVALVGT